MKKNSFALVFLFSFSGCATAWQGYTEHSLVRVTDDRLYMPVDASTFGAKSEDMELTYLPDITDSGLNFEFRNISSQPIKIIWDESAYISESGDSQKVFHSGVTIKDRGSPMPASMIPPGAKISDIIIPIGNVSFGSTNWEYAPLCGQRSTFTHELDDAACLGKTFGIFLSYQVGQAAKNVTVHFRYVSKTPKAKTKS